MQHIAFDYGVSKTAIWKSIRWTEDILIKSMAFSLPSKRRLLEENSVKAVLIDATECEIERPKKTEDLLLGQEKETYAKDTDCGRRAYF